MLNNLSGRSPLESSSAFWKSGKNFKLEELTNSILAGYSFTENLLWEFSETSKAISATVSRVKFIDQLLLVIKEYRPPDFLKKQRE